jgi:hypothetical protein
MMHQVEGLGMGFDNDQRLQTNCKRSFLGMFLERWGADRLG